jgi:uncharacterized protein
MFYCSVMAGVLVPLTRKNSGEEWPESLRPSDLRALGWTARPFTEFVVKVHSRCNLACDYCYLYELGDASWKDQPGRMSLSVAEAVGNRIAEQATRHGLVGVRMVLHGGEPLLAGEPHIRRLLELWTELITPVTRLSFSMQTNGLLLTDEMLDTLARFDVSIGVSLDGGITHNDRHRMHRNGAGSYQAVAERLHTWKQSVHWPLFAGILAVIDIENDPVETYEALCAFDPPKIDLMFPHANWHTPPPGVQQAGSAAPYAAWLIAVFDHWFDSPRDEPSIRLFDAIIRLLHGEPSSFESVGLAPVTLVVVQPDGSIEQVDTLKSSFDGAAETNASVFRESFDDVANNTSIAARQLGREGLSDACRRCAVVQTCGGGYYPHRYRPGSGFLNPSVYCADLLALITHVSERCGAT